MTRLQDTHPFAYHVFPVHAAKSIWAAGALLSKEQSPFSRRTTAAVDRALGFLGYVHFYLPRGGGRSLLDLPILGAQLGPGDRDTCPHAVLRITTAGLREEDCTICCWNIAVSRPAVPSRNVKGGNWARGTAPDRIAEVWDWFRAERPDARRARGYWHEPFKVPVLVGSEIDANLSLLGSAPRSSPELLLRAPLALSVPMEVITFSEGDERLLRLLGPPPGSVSFARSEFPFYEGPTADQERLIAAYLRTDGGAPPDIDFDARR